MTRTTPNSGRASDIWAIGLLLLAAVVIPTTCVLWFMAEAIRNERLAVRQRIVDAYSVCLNEAEEALDAFWQERRSILASTQPDAPPARTFDALVRTGLCDSAVVWNDASIYPTLQTEGRLAALNTQLAAAKGATSQTLDLARRVADYREPVIPSGQRRFLMDQLIEIAPDDVAFPTRAAEELATQWLEGGTDPTSHHLLDGVPSQRDGVWTLGVRTAESGRLALFRDEDLIVAMRAVLHDVSVPSRATIRLEKAESESFMSLPLSDLLPGWRLDLLIEGGDPFAEAARRQTALYAWTGLLSALAIALLALPVARHVGRQMKLTRLKNNLIATVSHELKTPVASVRVLLDTMLGGRCRDADQEREYLEIMARENERLGRLIDNFLTFSRMERNKQVFDLRSIEPEEIVQEAAQAVRERFDAVECHFEVDVQESLPTVIADRNSLATALVNLLDNALKYSPDKKIVTLRAYADGDAVCFEVEDRGVGLSRRQQKHIFERFYQVDQSLSRDTGGCGLGLSIVRFIVEGHGGRVSVASEPGKGSRFTIRLPQEKETR
jgi:two-component system, OmpR family, phosphate regulon sensor histidine kinase PhoR